MSTLDAKDETAASRWPVVELRQYTLHDGGRDTLISLFDREFVEPQEALGARVLAQFRDLDDANRFVWLRGFESMAARPAALAAFYDGPVWKAHREAANATMIDSDDVLLLRPVEMNERMPMEQWQRGSSKSTSRQSISTQRISTQSIAVEPRAAVLIAVFSMQSTADSLTKSAPGTTPRPSGLPRDFLDALSTHLEDNGGVEAGCYVSESAPNNFPRLPIRDGARVFVWIAQFAHAACRDTVAAALGTGVGQPCSRPRPNSDSAWPAPLQVLRLEPTSRSRH